jgi:hypothetical protein
MPRRVSGAQNSSAPRNSPDSPTAPASSTRATGSLSVGFLARSSTPTAPASRAQNLPPPPRIGPDHEPTNDALGEEPVTMACTRENPCGGLLYDDQQTLELARAGISRRVQKCLAGHEFWEGDLLRLFDETETSSADRRAPRRRTRRPMKTWRCRWCNRLYRAVARRGSCQRKPCALRERRRARRARKSS